jgi:hypothetical protein
VTGSCLVTSPEFTKESSLIRGVCQISQILLECRGNHILYCDCGMITGMSLVLGVVFNPGVSLFTMSCTSALQVVLAISLPDLADLVN